MMKAGEKEQAEYREIEKRKKELVGEQTLKQVARSVDGRENVKMEEKK